MSQLCEHGAWSEDCPRCRRAALIGCFGAIAFCVVSWALVILAFCMVTKPKP
jgi:hypothetical protein